MAQTIPRSFFHQQGGDIMQQGLGSLGYGRARRVTRLPHSYQQHFLSGGGHYLGDLGQTDPATDIGTTLTNAISTFFSQLGLRLGGTQTPVQPAAWSLGSPGTWGIGTYILIGGIIYLVASRR